MKAFPKSQSMLIADSANSATNVWFMLLVMLSFIYFASGIQMGGSAGSLIDGDSEYETQTSRNTKVPGRTKKLPTGPIFNSSMSNLAKLLAVFSLIYFAAGIRMGGYAGGISYGDDDPVGLNSKALKMGGNEGSIPFRHPNADNKYRKATDGNIKVSGRRGRRMRGKAGKLTNKEAGKTKKPKLVNITMEGRLLPIEIDLD
ncbi:unnamed protein product [Cylicocyclus nassatus]|uniref:Uncharacterized protein n=1 Tax=Cylicocyclus nassatus TaxID=53992 RepID=A0AA36DL12_CYLNA|nr:unnamed protein product [Cylicocyclus nassatus]